MFLKIETFLQQQQQKKKHNLGNQKLGLFAEDTLHTFLMIP